MLRAWGQGLVEARKKGRRKGDKKLRTRRPAVALPYLLSTGSQLVRTRNAPRQVQALLFDSTGLGGGGDTLDGRHRPGHPQQPLRGGSGDGAPQGNSLGTSPWIQRGCTGMGMGNQLVPEDQGVEGGFRPQPWEGLGWRGERPDLPPAPPLID